MVSASTLAALPVTPSVEPYTSRPPYIVDIGGSPLHLLGYFVAAVAVSDVEVTHQLVVISELEFPLWIGNDILRPHGAVIELGPFDVVRLGNDRSPECVDQLIPVTLLRDVAEAVASVLSADMTLFSHAASRKPVHLSHTVHSDQATTVEALPCGLVPTANAVFSEVNATIVAGRVFSATRASKKPVVIRAGFPIAAVSSVTPPQLSPPAFYRQARDSRSDARRPRRKRGRLRAPKRGVTSTSNAVRRRSSPSSSVSHHSVDVVHRTRDAMLRWRKLSFGEILVYGASFGFAMIWFPY